MPGSTSTQARSTSSGSNELAREGRASDQPETVVEHDRSHLNELARATVRAVAEFLTHGASEEGRWRVECANSSMGPSREG
jgi:hypothetical protein